MNHLYYVQMESFLAVFEIKCMIGIFNFAIIKISVAPNFQFPTIYSFS